jgi:hypothetical protein
MEEAQEAAPDLGKTRWCSGCHEEMNILAQQALA